MRTLFAVLGLICALPLSASAQAGFLDKPFWLSDAKPVAGEEISLSTVLYNGTDVAVAGALTFFVDDAKFTSQDVSLAAQSSNVISARWTATSGTHVFSARFETKDGADSAQQTSTIKIAVAEPPPPPPPPPPSALQETVDKATHVAGNIASSSAPFVQQVAQTVFTQTEAMRNAGITYLEKKVDAKKVDPKDTSNTTGFASTASAEASPSSGSTLHNIGQAALAATLFTMRSFYLFYPILAFIFLFALYWAYKKLRRPNRYGP